MKVRPESFCIPSSSPRSWRSSKSAHSSLGVYNEEIASSAIIGALKKAAAGGMDVEIVMNQSGQWTNAFKELSAAGAHIHLHEPNAAIYIHAKMILADSTKAFVGSEIFSSSSLGEGRELGIITTATNIAAPLTQTFDADYAASQPFVAPATAPPK